MANSKSNCSKCGRFTLFPDSHRCPDQWTVSIEDWGEQTVYAFDAEEAAEKVTEEWDQEDHSLLYDNDSIEVNVTSTDGIETTFEVRGDVEPRYYATILEDTP